MVRAQNDVFMVTPDTTAYEDNLTDALADGRLTRAELTRSAENICRFLMESPAFAALTECDTPVEQKNRPAEFSSEDLGSMTAHKIGTDTVIPLAEYPTDAGTFFVLALTFEQEGTYRFSLAASTLSLIHI